MKSRPIIFSGPMVRAILDGRKTQTRRVVKPQPREVVFGYNIAPHTVFYDGKSEAIQRHYCCPYGQPGDLLWVRETWRITNWIPDDGELKIRYEADDGTAWRQVPEEDDFDGEIYDRYWIESTDDFEKAGFQFIPHCATCEEGEWIRDGEKLTDQIVTRKRPSIHMPRWASRLTLRITDVRVGRVQEISEQDARAEGYPYFERLTTNMPIRTDFRSLWDSINAKRGYSWESNPWVWVVEFEVIRSNIDDVIRDIYGRESALA